MSEHASKLAAHTFTTHAEKRGIRLQCGSGPRLDFKVETSGESDGSQNAQAILGETFRRHTHRAKKSSFKIRSTIEVIDQSTTDGILEHRVHGEIPSSRVFDLASESNGLRMATVEIAPVAAEGRDFQSVPATPDEHDTEGFPHAHRMGKERLHSIGRRIGGDVVVGRIETEQTITNASACEIRDVSVLLQMPCDIRGILSWIDWFHDLRIVSGVSAKGRPTALQQAIARHCVRARSYAPRAEACRFPDAVAPKRPEALP